MRLEKVATPIKPAALTTERVSSCTLFVGAGDTTVGSDMNRDSSGTTPGSLSNRRLARNIDEGSSRKRADAKRDGHSEARDWLCCLRQCLSRFSDGDRHQEEGCQSPTYVEGLNGETARRSRVSALTAEASLIMRVRAPESTCPATRWGCRRNRQDWPARGGPRTQQSPHRWRRSLVRFECHRGCR